MIPRYRAQQLFHNLDDAMSQWVALKVYLGVDDDKNFESIDKLLTQVKEYLTIDTVPGSRLSDHDFDTMIDMTKENGYIDTYLDGYYDRLVVDNGSLQRFHEFADTWTRIQQNFKFIAHDLDDG